MRNNTSELNYLINSRSSLLTQEIHDTAKKMGIPQETIQSLNLHFNLTSLNCMEIHIASKQIAPDKRRCVLHIPLPYLIEPLDLQKTNSLYQQTLSIYSSLSLEKKRYALFFFDLLKTGHFNSMKTFVLSHELAHLANDDVHLDNSTGQQGIPLWQKIDPIYSCQKEKRADLTAAALSGQTQAGIEFMQVASKHLPDTPSHPSWKNRATYLKKFAEMGNLYLWKKVSKYSQTLGDPLLITNSPFSRSPDRVLSSLHIRTDQPRPRQASLTFDQEINIHQLHFPHECLLDKID